MKTFTKPPPHQRNLYKIRAYKNEEYQSTQKECEADRLPSLSTIYQQPENQPKNKKKATATE